MIRGGEIPSHTGIPITQVYSVLCLLCLLCSALENAAGLKMCHLMAVTPDFHLCTQGQVMCENRWAASSGMNIFLCAVLLGGSSGEGENTKPLLLAASPPVHMDGRCIQGLDLAFPSAGLVYVSALAAVSA